MTAYEEVALAAKVNELAFQIAPIFAANSNDKDKLAVLRLASDLDEEDEALVENIHRSCFPVFEKVIKVVHDPLRQIYHWLRSLSMKDIVMQTDMTGAFTIVFSGKRPKPLRGGKLSRRALWLRERFQLLWPVVVPNGGKPFLVVVRGSVYYVLEPN